LCGSRTYYAEALAAGRWSELYRVLNRDSRDVGLASSVWWLVRDGLLPLLPATFKDPLRKVMRGNPIGGFAPRTWLTPTMRNLLEQRRQKYRQSGKVKVARIGQRRQGSLSGAFSTLAREVEERLSSSVGLELRRPFWNASMVQFSLTTPERLRLQGRVDKALHRQAMSGLLPESVLKRESKAEFSIVFRRYLLDMKETLTQRIPARHPDWVDPRQAARLHDCLSHPDRSGYAEWMLWSLFGCDAVCGGWG